MVLGVKRKPPELGAGGFALFFEEDSVVFGEHYDRRFLKENAAVMVAEGGNAHEIVVEVGHGVPGGVESWERRMLQAAEERWDTPPAVPTTT